MAPEPGHPERGERAGLKALAGVHLLLIIGYV